MLTSAATRRRSAEPTLLFVYGTLRAPSTHPMARLLARHGRFVGDASLQGQLFMVTHYPGAVPSADPADSVRGEVYALARAAALLRELDAYEGYDPRARDNEYLRREHTVTLASGGHVTAWVYIYNRPTRGLRRIASGDFTSIAG